MKPRALAGVRPVALVTAVAVSLVLWGLVGLSAAEWWQTAILPFLVAQHFYILIGVLCAVSLGLCWPDHPRDRG